MGRLTRGSRVLAGRYGGWVAADGLRAGLARVTGSAGAGGLGIWTAATAAPWLAGAAGIAWTATACAVAGRAEGQGEGDEAEPEELPAAAFVELVRAALDGDSGAHLATVARHIGGALDEEWTTGDVRAHAEAAGIPVAPSVRAGGQVSTGIRARDLPPPPPLSESEEGRSPAGHRATATATDLEVDRSHAGMWIIRDPADTRRHTTVTTTKQHEQEHR